VLEVGVGTGRSVSHYPGDARLVAIDISEAMLRLARERALASNRSVELRLSLAPGDVEVPSPHNLGLPLQKAILKSGCYTPKNTDDGRRAIRCRAADQGDD
jgi:hypothetical protein